MQLLGARVPQIIEGHFGDDELFRKNLRDVYRVKQTGMNKILQRARALLAQCLTRKTAFGNDSGVVA